MDAPVPSEGVKTLNQLLGETDMPEVQKGSDGRKYYMIYISVQDGPVVKKKCVHVDCDLAQSIFEDYVIHGANMTGLEVQKKYGMTGKTWQAFKTCMNLVKHSLPIPYDKLKHMTDLEIEDELETIIEEGVDTRVGRLLDRASDRKRGKMIDDMAVKLSTTEAWTNEIMEKWNLVMRDSPKRPIHTQVRTVQSVSFILSDPHFGNKETYRTMERLKRTIAELKGESAERINIIMLGDDGEDFTQAGIHSDTKLSMHRDFREPTKLIMFIAELYTDMITQLAQDKQVGVYKVSGNHDRVTAKREDDQVRMAGWMISELIRRHIPEEVEFLSTQEPMLVKVLSGNEFFMMHGDRKLGDMKATDIVAENTRSGKLDKVVLRGHRHKPSYEKRGKVHDIRVGAFTAPGDHEVREGYTGRSVNPQATLIKTDKQGSLAIEYRTV